MNLGEVGEHVRLRRVELRWTQAQLADKARVALGTVQALEDAQNRKRPRQTSPEKLQRIAKALGRTIEDLIKDRKEIEPSNPLLRGLNDEHLEIARWYMQARKRTRELVDALVALGTDERRMSELLLRVVRLPQDRWRSVELWLEASNPTIAASGDSKKAKQAGAS